MSNTQNAPPAATHRDGAVFAKVWRNWNQKGEPFYSLDIGRTYTDTKTGKLRESNSFTGTDILKIGPLSNKAYESIGQLREADRAKERSQVQPEQNGYAPQQPSQPAQGDIAAQRDAVMGQAAPQQHAQAPAPEREH